MADAPAGPARRLRHRHRRDTLRAGVRRGGLPARRIWTGSSTSRSTPGTSARPRSICCWATRARPHVNWTGSPRSVSHNSSNDGGPRLGAGPRGAGACRPSPQSGTGRPHMLDLRQERIVVTGGGGFLGRHLQDRLRNEGVPQQQVLVPREHGVRPDTRGRRGSHVSAVEANRGHPPGGPGRRHRREPREPRRVLLRQHGDGPAPDRARAARRAEKVRPGRHDLRLSQVHARALPRGGPLERLSRGDQRPLRHRQEGPAGDAPGLSPAVRPQRHLSAAGEPVRAGRQLRSAVIARHPGLDPQVRARPNERGEDEVVVWGTGQAQPRVPLRRGLRGASFGHSALRQPGAGQSRRGLRDHDPRSGGEDPPPRRL